MSIPKIIHQIWIGPKEPPTFMSMWKKINPEYTYILWTEEEIKSLLPLTNQRIYDEYGNNFAGKSDIVRLEILKKYGGIYIDADTEPLRPLEGDFLNSDFFTCYINETKRPGRIANGVIGSIPNHEIINVFINKINDLEDLNNKAFILTGPVAFTKIIENFKNDITILPSYYFYPYFFEDFEYKGNFKPFGDHKWGTTKNIYKEKKTKKDITIIVPTYNNVNYINESLDSMVKSFCNYNCEILVGIDGCSETLQHIKNNSYNDNIKFYYFEKNEGPYSIKNTLAKKANSDNLLFFDSDDIMLSNMLNDFLPKIKSYFILKPKFENFSHGIPIKGKKISHGEGVFAIKKIDFINMNGFEPWVCAADSDFMSRVYKKKLPVYLSQDILFKRRIHNQGLTSRKETGLSSALRGSYVKIMNNKKGDGNPNKLHTRDFVMVDVNTIIVDTKNHEYYNHRKSQLDKVLTPVPRKVVSQPTKKKDPVINDRTDVLYSNPKPLVRTIKPNKPDSRQELINLKNNTNKSIHKQLFNTKPERRSGINPITIGGKSRT